VWGSAPLRRLLDPERFGRLVVASKDEFGLRTKILNLLRRVWLLPGLEGLAAAMFGRS
jgi:hypothetical protein